MAINPDNLLGQSNPNGTVGVSLGIDPIGANEAFSAGVTSGFQVSPTSPAGMSVTVGGQAGVIDSALVRSVSGITFPVGNTSGTPITLTVPAAPTTNSRIDSVVLYVDTTVTATETDGADALGMEIVSGTSASSPSAPTDSQIRSAIQNGASIAYIVIANITVASGATTITTSDIAQTSSANISADKVDFATMPIYSKSNASAVSLSSSDVKIVEITVGSAGNYVAMGFMQTSGNGGGANLSLQLRRNGTIYGPRLQYNWDLGQNTWGIFANVQRVIPLNAGDTVALWGGNSRNQRTDANASNLTLIKVSN